jgi:hypothetical protein
MMEVCERTPGWGFVSREEYPERIQVRDPYAKLRGEFVTALCDSPSCKTEIEQLRAKNKDLAAEMKGFADQMKAQVEAQESVM